MVVSNNGDEIIEMSEKVSNGGMKKTKGKYFSLIKKIGRDFLQIFWSHFGYQT